MEGEQDDLQLVVGQSLRSRDRIWMRVRKGVKKKEMDRSKDGLCKCQNFQTFRMGKGKKKGLLEGSQNNNEVSLEWKCT